MSMAGKKHSDETRAKMARTRKEAPPISEETRAKMRASALKRSIKPETKEKMNAARAKRKALEKELHSLVAELIAKIKAVVAVSKGNR